MFCFSSHELRPFITVFLYSYFSTCCILGKNTIKILIFSVTLYCQSLCQIQTQKSEDRLCINDNTVIKYINIKITSAGCTDKLLCTFSSSLICFSIADRLPFWFFIFQFYTKVKFLSILFISYQTFFDTMYNIFVFPLEILLNLIVLFLDKS